MVGTAPAGTNRLSARELAAATPATRNRYADLLRAGSIFVVVVGHWLMAVLGWHDGSFTGKNLLEIAPWTHILTWIFQVMPIFFIVGGFTNAGSWRSAGERGVSYADWLRARSARLLRPALIFVASGPSCRCSPSRWDCHPASRAPVAGRSRSPSGSWPSIC